MRLPFSGTDSLSNKTRDSVERILNLYASLLAPAIEMKSAEAMVADGSVIQTDTFDPGKVEGIFNRLKAELRGWDSCEISSSETDDVRRIYCQIIKQIGRHYRLSGYFGVQFHVLPYYKSDRRIPEIRQFLARLEESAAKIFVSYSSAADTALGKELRSVGLADLGTEELLAKMFEDDQLRERLDQKNDEVKHGYPELEHITRQRDALLSELNGYVLEFYQTTSVLLDSVRLLSGEEGIVAYFDIERVSQRKGKRGAQPETAGNAFDPSKVSAPEGRAIVESLEQVAEIFKTLTPKG